MLDVKNMPNLNLQISQIKIQISLQLCVNCYKKRKGTKVLVKRKVNIDEVKHFIDKILSIRNMNASIF